MTATITESGTSERLVGFEITDDELDTAKAVAARRLAKELRVPGFRPGKAPRRVVEATVGTERLRSEAIDDAIPPKLTLILTDNELIPAVTPSLENVDDNDDGISVEVKITLWPVIEKLPEYKDRKYEIESPEVTTEELDEQIGRMLDQYATVEEVERPAEKGDYLSLDLSAERDEETVEGTVGSDLLYELGSGLLIEGLDDQLEGAAEGTEVTFDAPLPGIPEDADDAEATFTVKVNEVKEKIRPPLDDEWVEENTEFDTVAELRKELENRIGEVKLGNLVRGFPDFVMDTLRSEIEVELPDALLQGEMDDTVHRFLHRLEEQEVTLEDYFEATGLNQQTFLDDVRQGGERSLEIRILLEAVAAAENLDVPDDEFQVAMDATVAQADDPAAARKALEGSAGLSARTDMLRQKAVGLILENATTVDGDGNEIDLELGAPETIEVGTDETNDMGDDVVTGEVVDAEIVEGEIVTPYELSPENTSSQSS